MYVYQMNVHKPNNQVKASMFILFESEQRHSIFNKILNVLILKH